MDFVSAIKFLIAFCLFTVTALLSPPAMCQGEEDFNYDLNSKKGPLFWGKIRPEWYLCKNGTMQSPINLVGVNAVFDSGTRWNYQPSNATLRATDHDVTINFNGNAGNITINGTQYRLVQTHWHSPSEHYINGKRYDLEVHMVHNSSTGQTAVTGAVYRKGPKPDPFLSSIEDALMLIAENRSQARAVGIVHPNQIVNVTGSNYFRYNGSLTTPPCHQGVIWTLFTKEQYTNARPLQPRNNRQVQLYKPTNR
ncbi:hypothetical protein RJT34_18439 [Clitoria ternatea]|uniref:Carbonic anhydrase n=1 Tax=Clitoria ternatea TaxID=43366 RepID=A0AAN9JC37_CLITE